MTDIGLALAVHVVAVVLWRGTLRGVPPLESRFAHQARITTVLAGASGLYMTWRLDAWSWFHSADTWWMGKAAAKFTFNAS